ncbi:MAG: PqqD family protein [Pseudomonadota bacterium]
MKSGNGTAYFVDAETVAWNVVGDEVVIIHAETSEYFSLNHTGTMVWNRLVAGACHEEDLVQLVARQFEKNDTDVGQDVSSFLAKLKQSQLLSEHDSGKANGAAPSEAGLADDASVYPYEPPDVVKFGDLETLILSGE